MGQLDPHTISTVGIIGGGTIGASWAAYYLSRGLTVIVVDPFVEPAKLEATIRQMWQHLESLGLPPQANRENLAIYQEINASLEKVDVVQECCPEKLALKHQILAELERVVAPHVPIISSTSSLMASDIQSECRYGERVLVGHPFNPPHLLPLVEVVGGQKTSPEVIEWALDFYRWIGKVPVHVKKEAPGHIANRLTAALYREAVHIVTEGIGSVADVDSAITNGPGLRWALMGPHLIYHLGGGEGGIRHYLEHLGTAQENRWQSLGSPHLDEATKQKLIDGVEALVGDQSITELSQQRDEKLVKLLQLLRLA